MHLNSNTSSMYYNYYFIMIVIIKNYQKIKKIKEILNTFSKSMIKIANQNIFEEWSSGHKQYINIQMNIHGCSLRKCLS